MHKQYAAVPAMVILISVLAFTIASVQSYDSLDIHIPSSFPLKPAEAYCTDLSTSGVGGNMSLSYYGDAALLSVPTNASGSHVLSYFQDANTSTLFENGTMYIPLVSHGDRVASLLLFMDDMVSSNGRFIGQVTGAELDTAALGEEYASAETTIYLNSLHRDASYSVEKIHDSDIEDTLLKEASGNGASGIIGDLMVEVSGDTSAPNDSIGYILVRMKPNGLDIDGDVTAYLYSGGNVSQIQCNAVETDEGTVYEAISPGPGVFAFAGNYQAPPQVPEILQSVTVFMGAIAALVFLLVALVMRVHKKMKN